MRTFFASIKTVGIIVGLFLLHILLVTNLPSPFNQFNIITIFLAWLALRSHTNAALAFAVVFGFLNSLFSSEAFGLSVFAMLCTLVLFNWMLMTIFTSHSWYMILLAGCLFVLSYQIIFLVAVSAFNLFTRQPLVLTTNIFWIGGLSVFINALGLVFIFSMTNLFVERRGPRYI